MYIQAEARGDLLRVISGLWRPDAAVAAARETLQQQQRAFSSSAEAIALNSKVSHWLLSFGFIAGSALCGHLFKCGSKKCEAISHGLERRLAAVRKLQFCCRLIHEAATARRPPSELCVEVLRTQPLFSIHYGLDAA